ncbi:NfeD family protein [Thermoanaerobacterium thermosaccharolyticum]|uniref:Membrane protein implicated in regulation of membrane protease activity n=1 Tax=Thermoanaerobacterium thermosaccharolyticum M0795 TaxID=698948 RepID=L0IP88_THETR|nr:NfeD family protein [Thermoanaerobacterium thermosaccharolyticum]AGB20041.1 membrane protein implicated in regulation of membrane protease activity [Thermoanaerobacterium thermosaccharolyticum M0795]
MTLWLAVMIVGIAIDLITSNFIFFNFSIGAFFAICADLLGLNTPIQIFIFLAIGIVSLIFSFKYLRKRFKNIPKTYSYESEYIGKTIEIKSDVGREGQVFFEGIYWTVKSDEPLKNGDTALITGISGNKLIVKRLEE